MPALQQHGIARRTPRPLRIPWRGGRDPAELRADVDALRTALTHLTDQVNQMEDRIVRRLNELVLSGTLAQRPAAGVADRLYFSTDQAVGARLRFDDGTAWQAP